jgi:hypothetical protein
MKRIDNWNEIQAVTGGSEQLPAGVYKCGIVAASAETSKKGQEMLVLALEVIEGDYQGIFSRTCKRKRQFNPQAKWPCNYYQVTEGEQVGRYKGLTVAIEQSNPGYKWDFDENTLKGKTCACIFREEEFISQQDGKVHNATRAYQIIPVDEMANATVPPKKCVEQPPAAGGFGGYDDSESIPF